MPRLPCRRPIVFPGGGTAVPADRVAEHNHLGVWFYFLVLFGVAVSVLLGSAMHRNHMYTFPESGATVRRLACALRPRLFVLAPCLLAQLRGCLACLVTLYCVVSPCMLICCVQLIVGMAIGLFLLAVSNPSLIQHAKFDPE
jgi:hypothetical protein